MLSIAAGRADGLRCAGVFIRRAVKLTEFSMLCHRCLFAVLASLPAMIVGSMFFLGFEEDAYYTRPWQIAAVVFFVASFLFGLNIPVQRADQRDSLTAIRVRFFVYPCLAWTLAVAVLFVLSFTPMVLGQENGDGTNNFANCVIFAIFSSCVYSGLAITVILLNSLLVGISLAPLQAKQIDLSNR